MKPHPPSQGSTQKFGGGGTISPSLQNIHTDLFYFITINTLIFDHPFAISPTLCLPSVNLWNGWGGGGGGPLAPTLLLRKL